MQHYLDQGYAVYSLSQRGFGESCRTQESRDADPTGCAKGYVHLMDIRYEVRDSQLLLGELVDEGLVDPNKIAATGGSYGGGMSLEMAALKDRTMLLDGTLVPWESPDGTPMSLAVASPNIPWSELTYALAPNGNNLDYIEDAGYFGRVGVMKESYVQGLSTQGFKAPVGSDPRADIDGWKARLDQGEPYDGDPAVAAMIDEINTYHSAYGVDHSEAPAPLLISSGFTDDLFPVNEATRFYNRTRAEYPDTPLALFFGSFGHPRGQNQANVVPALGEPRGRVARPLPEGDRAGARLERDDLHADLPAGQRRRRSLHGSGLGIDRARRDPPPRRRRPADGRPERRRSSGRRAVQPARRNRLLEPRPAPRSPGPPTTSCRRPRPAATR